MTRAGTNRLIGTLLGVTGLTLMLGGGYLAWKSVSEYDSVNGVRLTRVKSAIAAQCMSGLDSALGAKPTKIGDTVQLHKLGLDEPELTLARASVGLLRCPGMRIMQFCYGEGCKYPGLSMSLRLNPLASEQDSEPATPATPATPAVKPKT